MTTDIASSRVLKIKDAASERDEILPVFRALLGNSSGPGGGGGGGTGGGTGGGDGNDPGGNQAPNRISLSNQSIQENRRRNSVVGTLSTRDPDQGDRHTYTLVSGNDAFGLRGNVLRTKQSFDFEKRRSYTIRVLTEDQNGLGYEQNFVINVRDVNDTASDPGADQRRSATSLGALTSTLTRNDSIGFPVRSGRRRGRTKVDRNDYYSVDLRQAGSLTVGLSKLKADADFHILSSSGQILARSTANRSKNDSFTLDNLSAGTYLVRVFPGSGRVQTRYRLSLSTTPTPPPPPIRDPIPFQPPVGEGQPSSGGGTTPPGGGGGTTPPGGGGGGGTTPPGGGGGGGTTPPGGGGGTTPPGGGGTTPLPPPPIDSNGTFDNALFIGTVPVFDLNASIFDAATESLALADPGGNIGFTFDYGRDVNDYLRFTLASPGDLSVSIAGLTDDADLRIYNSSRVQIGSSLNSGSESDQVFLPNLAAGDYYALVETGTTTAQTDYQIKLIANTSGYLDDGFAVSQDLGTLVGAGFLSADDSLFDSIDNDFFRFKVNSSFTGSSVFIYLYNFLEDIDMEVYNSEFERIYPTTGPQYGTTAESFLLDSTNGLKAGDTYYVRVRPFLESSPYTLEIYG